MADAMAKRFLGLEWAEWRFWLLWVLASTVGLAPFTPLYILAQWLVLRKRFWGAALWLSNIVFVGWTAFICGLSPAFVVLGSGWDVRNHLSFVWIPLFLGGALQGISQWLALRDLLEGSGWLVLANAVAVPGAVVAAWNLFWSMEWDDPAAYIVSGAVAGAIYGAITGAVLVWLLRHPVQESRDMGGVYRARMRNKGKGESDAHESTRHDRGGSQV